MKLEEAKQVLNRWLANYPESDTTEAVVTLLDYADEGREGRTIHDLKLSTNFCDAVYTGMRTFDLRKNDRGFQTGDLIRYTPVKFDESETAARFPSHPIQGELYEITYILSGWGLQPDCVALGIREKNDF